MVGFLSTNGFKLTGMIFYNHSSLVTLVKDAKYISFLPNFSSSSCPSHWARLKPQKSWKSRKSRKKQWNKVIALSSIKKEKYIHNNKKFIWYSLRRIFFLISAFSFQPYTRKRKLWNYGNSSKAPYSCHMRM